MIFTLASSLLAASAFVILVLGLMHLLITFRGNKLYPRDAALETALKTVSPIITRETTMWKAWIGFNASHSYGAILFGLIYGYLAIVHASLLFASSFLLSVGMLMLLGYCYLGFRYWFSVPFRGIAIATALYVGGLAISWL